MKIKNDDGKRIKSCWDCSHHYESMYWFGCIEGLEDTDIYKPVGSSEKEIPGWCRLPDWRRTLEVKID